MLWNCAHACGMQSRASLLNSVDRAKSMDDLGCKRGPRKYDSWIYSWCHCGSVFTCMRHAAAAAAARPRPGVVKTVGKAHVDWDATEQRRGEIEAAKGGVQVSAARMDIDSAGERVVVPVGTKTKVEVTVTNTSAEITRQFSAHLLFDSQKIFKCSQSAVTTIAPGVTKRFCVTCAPTQPGVSRCVLVLQFVGFSIGRFLMLHCGDRETDTLLRPVAPYVGRRKTPKKFQGSVVAGERIFKPRASVDSRKAILGEIPFLTLQLDHASGISGCTPFRCKGTISTQTDVRSVSLCLYCSFSLICILSLSQACILCPTICEKRCLQTTARRCFRKTKKHSSNTKTSMYTKRHMPDYCGPRRSRWKGTFDCSTSRTYN